MRRFMRVISLGLLAMMLAAAACAQAEGPAQATAPELTWYDYGDGMNIRSLLPLDVGGVLLAGSVTYADQKMLEPFWTGYEELPERTDAYAIALDCGGERQWAQQLNDPRAYNSFDGAWWLEDGRYLLRYRNADGCWGTQYYILSEQGTIDEMIPAQRLRELGADSPLTPVPGGYLLGGIRHDSTGLVSGMKANDALIFLNEAYEEVWRIQDERLLGGMYDVIRPCGDGILLCGDVALPIGGRYMASAMKVSHEGEILWKFTGHKYAAASFEDCWPLPDGGVLLVSGNDPQAGTPIDQKDAGSLTLINAKGEVEWTRLYLEDCGLSWLRSIRPLGDGFVLLGDLEEYRGTGVVYVDAQGNPKSMFSIVLDDPQSMYAYAYLESAPDGSVYLYGTESRYDPPEDVQPARVFYARLEEEAFTE